MKASKTFRRVVIITVIATTVCLGVAAVIGLATSGFIPSPFAGTRIAVDESKSLPVSGVDLVTIDTVSDNVRVIEGAGDAVVARLHGTVGSTSPDAVPHLAAERVGSADAFRLERVRRFTFGFNWNHLVLEVSVPKDYRGKLNVTSVSADLDVADHAYEGLALSTTSGSMRVTGVSGDISARSVSGDLAIAFAAANRKLDAQSTSGRVTVRLPADASFALDAHSTSGSVTCRFPIVVGDSSNGGGSRALIGTVGTGSGRVAVRTVSGDIRVTP